MAEPLTIALALAGALLRFAKSDDSPGPGTSPAEHTPPLDAATTKLIAYAQDLLMNSTSNLLSDDLSRLGGQFGAWWDAAKKDQNEDVSRALIKSALCADYFCLEESLNVASELPTAMPDWFQAVWTRRPEWARLAPQSLFRHADRAQLVALRNSRLEKIRNLQVSPDQMTLDPRSLISDRVGRDYAERCVKDAVAAMELESGAALPEHLRYVMQERWFPYVAHYFQHEIKENHRVSRILSAASSERIESLLEALSVGLLEGPSQGLLKPTAAKLDQGFGAFGYELAVDAFVGRERLLDDFLAQFLPEPTEQVPRFRWHVLLGRAGVGKSRFGQELAARARPQWRVSGFLDSDVLKRANWPVWRPKVPTFVIVDYAQMNLSNVKSMLKWLARNAHEYTHPVRVLLMDRSVFRESLESMLLPFTEDDLLRASQFSTMPQDLPSLSDAALLSIVRGRIQLSGGVAVDLTANDLMKALRAVDPDEMRPIWAALVGEEIGRGELDVERLQADGSPREQILSHALRREIKRWEDVAENRFAGSAAARGKLFKAHMSLLGLATLARTQLLSSLREGAHVEVRALAPMGFDLDSFDSELYGAMTSEIVDSSLGVLSPLEPDLLGEYFIDSYLSRQLPRRDWAQLVDFAWNQNPAGCRLAVGLIEIDFGTTGTDPLRHLPSATAITARCAEHVARALITVSYLVTLRTSHQYPEFAPWALPAVDRNTVRTSLFNQVFGEKTQGDSNAARTD